MDHVTRGRGAGDSRDILGTWSPYTRVSTRGRKDPRLFPRKGGGRRMRHPFLAPLVYPHVPDRTLNFGYDRLTRPRAVVVKTLASSGVADFQDVPSDVIIKEIFRNDQLSTLTRIFHAFHRYRVETLPEGRFIGWQPRDLSSKSYFIRLLDVSLGQGEDYVVEELGTRRPVMLREQVTISFKLIAEAQSPAGVVTSEGI
jgi:hypothetical protein